MACPRVLHRMDAENSEGEDEDGKATSQKVSAKLTCVVDRRPRPGDLRKYVVHSPIFQVIP